MDSYRDPLNAEAIRFPGSFRTKVLISAGLCVDFATAAGSVLDYISWQTRGIELGLLLAAAVFKICLWPGDIVADQFGLHKLGLLSRLAVRIEWSQIGEIRASTEFGGRWAAKLGFSTATLEIRSEDGERVIVHTPRHADRERLILQMRHHGATSAIMETL